MQRNCRTRLSVSLFQSLVLTFSISAASSDAQAQDRFVALTGKDDSNGCAISIDPCRTLGHAVKMMGTRSGTIRMGTGSFSETLISIVANPIAPVAFVVEGRWNDDFTQRTGSTILSTGAVAPPTLPWPGINPNARLFYIAALGGDLNLTFDGLTMERGSTAIGGCIYITASSGPGAGSNGSVTATVTIRDSSLRNCLAEKGGAIAVVLPNAGDAVDQALDENRIHLNLINSRISDSIAAGPTGSAIYAEILGSEIIDEGLSEFQLTVHDSVIESNHNSGRDIYIRTVGLDASSVLDFRRNYIAGSPPASQYGLIALENGMGGRLRTNFQNNLIYTPHPRQIAINVLCPPFDTAPRACPAVSLNHLHDTILSDYVISYASDQAGVATLNFKNSVLGGLYVPVIYGRPSDEYSTAEWSIVQNAGSSNFPRDNFTVNIESVFEHQQAQPDFRLAGDSWAVDRVTCDPAILVDRQGGARPDPISGKCDVGADELVHEIFDHGAVLLYRGGSDPVADIFSILDRGCDSETSCQRNHSPTTLEIDEGNLLPSIRTYQDSTARISGGTFRDGTIFEAYQDSRIEMIGSDFEFLFSPRNTFLPLPMGPVPFVSGELRGVLESGAQLRSVRFERYGGGESLGLGELILLPSSDSELFNFSTGSPRDEVTTIDQPIDVFAFVRNRFCDDQSWPCLVSPAPPPTSVVIAAPTMSFHVYDSSDATTLGRAVIRGQLVVADRASMTILFGEVQGAVGVFDEAELLIVDGDIQRSVGLFDQGALLIRGGTLGGNIIANHSSSIDLEAGDIAGRVFLYESAELVVHGKDFELNGSPTDLGDVVLDFGTLSGIYDSDTAFSFFFERNDESRVQLVAAPEPASMLMQAMSLISLAALRRNRSVRQA